MGFLEFLLKISISCIKYVIARVLGFEFSMNEISGIYFHGLRPLQLTRALVIAEIVQDGHSNADQQLIGGFLIFFTLLPSLVQLLTKLLDVVFVALEVNVLDPVLNPVQDGGNQREHKGDHQGNQCET